MLYGRGSEGQQTAISSALQPHEPFDAMKAVPAFHEKVLYCEHYLHCNRIMLV